MRGRGTVQGEPGDLLYHLRASHAVTPPERPQKRAQGGACAPGRPGRAQVHCVRTAGARGGGARRRGRRLPGRPNPTLSLDANAQVHCVPAAGPVAAELRGVAGGFPAGLVLHSWAGAAEVTRQLAAVRGVHFSLSGHTLRLAPHRLAPMLAQARTPEAAPPGLAARPVAQRDARSSVAEALPPGCRPAELAQSPRPPALQPTASRAPWAGPSVCRTSHE